MPPGTAIDGSDLKLESSRFVGRKLLFLLALVVSTVVLAGVSATLGSADAGVFDHGERNLLYGDDRLHRPCGAPHNQDGRGRRSQVSPAGFRGGGPLLLLGADTAARTVFAPVILPVGIMTSFLGVPFSFTCF